MSSSANPSTFDNIKSSFTTFGKDHGLIEKTPLEKAADLPGQAVDHAKALNNEVSSKYHTLAVCQILTLISLKPMM